MGRGRGKGKKSSADEGSSEEEKIPAQKRRGRPQKAFKEDTDEEEGEKIEEDDKTARVEQENGAATNNTEPSADDLAKPVVGRSSRGKRRKGTPHRAAQSGTPIEF